MSTKNAATTFALIPKEVLENENPRLPVVYQKAKIALEECTRIDECQEWADKAEILASYGKQASDDSLRKMADRIQARAIRRCGELLKEIEARSGARTDLGPAQTRGSVAAKAGLSDKQKKTALRVANVPSDSFEQQVESENPPTVTELANQGTKPRVVDYLKGKDPKDFAIATQASGTISDFAKFCLQSGSSLRITQ
jgi:hypothetical protein